MTTVTQDSSTPKFSDHILKMQTAITEDPSDLVAKINLAAAYEEEKHYQNAIEVYQQIIEQDKDGAFAGSATKAIEEIQRIFLGGEITQKDSDKKTKQESKDAVIKKQKKKYNLIQQVIDLPIGFKQFIALFSSSVVSIVGVVTAGQIITTSLGRHQLENQAIAELAVSVINYNSRISEMESGFRGQTDNTAIIQASQEYKKNGKISPKLKETVKKILTNEVSLRQIEYATLVGLDSRVIVNANQDRSGQIFDPNNLVQEVLKLPRRFQTNAIIPWSEIDKEKPIITANIKDQDVLVNFTFSPVQDPQTQEVIGLLIAGELVNGKVLALRKTIEAVGGGYNAIYLFNGTEFELVTSALQQKNNEQSEMETNIVLPNLNLLKKAQLGTGGNLVERMKIGEQWFTFAAKALPNYKGEQIAFIVRGTPETGLDKLLNQSLVLQIIVGSLTLIVAIILAVIFGRALTKPIKRLQQTAQKIGSGDRQVRAEVKSQDEVGQLANTFNEMAERIEAYTQAIEDIARQREIDAEFQKKQKENLQKSVINLLLDIEEASKGNLSVQADVVSGEVGSIADAFNATIRNLQTLVKEVITATHQVHECALANGQVVTNFSQNAMSQAQAIQMVGSSIEEIAVSIEQVNESAQNAAEIARQSRLAAEEGEQTMDETVSSIYQIRNTVADTSKKAKRLADSSQEISKIVSIISGISEKTNLLAFNASIEAARAGENGQGFRVVADEVRRLAEQVTFSAQEIEQLILGIQEETSQMMKMMEESTTQVVTGTKLVKTTKETLQKLAQISQEIDRLLASISESTVNQKTSSQKVTEKMQEVEVISKETAIESKTVAQSLQELLNVAMKLQQSASNFQVD
jgi:twitching motility protein PilJ